MDADAIAINQYLMQGLCCSQAIIKRALDMRGEQNEALVDASAGLCSGLFSGRLCGALSGAALMLSLFDKQEAASVMIPDLCDWFEETFAEQYGGVDCADIMQGNALTKKLRCPALTVETFKKARELLVLYDIIDE